MVAPRSRALFLVLLPCICDGMNPSRERGNQDTNAKDSFRHFEYQTERDWAHDILRWLEQFH